MLSFLHLLNGCFFALMGLAALVRPTLVTRWFGLTQLPPDMENEVRAVYGGFGLAMAGLLGWIYWWPTAGWQAGVLLTIAVALLGMAAGRLLSFAVTFTIGAGPFVFFILEVVLGASLLLLFFMLK